MDRAMRILLVDDERWIRDIFCQILTGSGHEVITAESGEMALDILSKNAVDILFFDLSMPVTGGQDVLQIAQEKFPEMPVIVATKHGDLNRAVECIRKGAYDFVTKPFQLDTLLRSIERAGERIRLEKRSREFEDEIVRTLLDLNTERKRLKTIISCMASGLLVTDRNLQVILHNPALLHMLGVREEIKNPFPLCQIIDDHSIMETLKRILSRGALEDEVISQEIHLGEKVLKAISTPALGPDRNVFWKVVGTVTVFEDITPFKKLDEMKSDFMHMVAHELRSPLVVTRSMLNALLEGLAGPLQGKQKDMVTKGMRKMDVLLELINDLLNVAKIEAGKYVQPHVTIDIGKIIEEIVAFTESRAKEQGIVLSYFGENLKPIQADPKSIEAVLSNLIVNAINYSPDGGRVTVMAKGVGDYVEITVGDTGVGIQPEELPKIFDKFYRVKHPKTRHVAGTGLGLAIVQGIVKAHHGTIDVKSIVNKGTTFIVNLPVASPS